MLEEEKAARWKDSVTGAAFVGWQLGVQTGAVKSTVTFEKYLRNFGLSDGPAPLTPEQRKAVTAQAHANADRIDAAFKAGRFKRVDVGFTVGNQV